MSTDQHRCVRWGTPFGRFVRTYGVAQLAEHLQIQPAAIYQWVRAKSSPHPPIARAITRLAFYHMMLEHCSGRAATARTCLKLEDIYSQMDLNADQNGN